MRHTAIITEITPRTHDTVTLSFLVDGAPLSHTAGQYITVYFDDTDVSEGKAYSLSSAPGDATSSITVKKVGLFSGKLHALRVGDRLEISVAYGSFNAYKTSPIVALAAGVGIGPLWSIIRDEHMRNTGRTIRLLYSTKTTADQLFYEEMVQLSDENPAFSCTHFVTQESTMKYPQRRIDPAKDAALYREDHCFYVCGSADFTRAMWHGLVNAGVPEEAISTETFFEERLWKQ